MNLNHFLDVYLSPITGIIIVISFILIPRSVLAIGLNFDYYTKVKFEYQYSDYEEFKWQPYIEYNFGKHEYTQPNPFLNSFPEHRGLTKITQGFGQNFELQLMYHYSYQGKEYYYDDTGNQGVFDTEEGFYNARGEYMVNNNLTVNGTIQYSEATAGLLDANTRKVADLRGWMGDFGFIYDFGGFFKIEQSISLFYNKVDDIDGGYVNSNAQSYNLKLRQALSHTTATQVKFNYFNSDPVAEEKGLRYGTFTWWISQWLPTESAVHFNLRYHKDNQGITSFGPGIEVSHYLNWATILTLSYRNNKMISDNPESDFYEVVRKGSFHSNAFTAMVTRTIWGDTIFVLKYRYYTTNQNISINTYMFSIEQVI